MSMTCPRCHTTDLDEKDRQGVKIDLCPSCRGVWLDRGELEKLIAVAVADRGGHRGDDEPDDHDHDDRAYQRPRRRDDDDDDDRGHPPRRRSSLWDLFD